MHTLIKNNTSKEHNELISEVLNFDSQIAITRPAKVKDGIQKFGKRQKKRHLKRFKKFAGRKSFGNFIPASGSGSRMFKELTVFCKDFKVEQDTFSSYVNKTKSYKLKEFFIHLKQFPFYNNLPNDIVKSTDPSISHDERKLLIAKYVIENLKLPQIPKALQYFHSYNNVPITAFEEQYNFHKLLADDFKSDELHFTINDAYLNEFKELLSTKSLDSDIINFSFQSKQTDALCLDEYNGLVTRDDGTILQKPAGHGTLLSNLNELNADIIHIHNIDNIPHQYLHSELAKEKQMLIGYLILLERKIHNYLELLEQNKLKRKKFKKFNRFCKKHLHVNFEQFLDNSKEGKLSTIYHFLNRPIRVCAMIPDRNHSGGGPYWIENDNGNSSLQIVESVEIPKNFRSKQLNSSHFNPVEIFCLTKNYKGERFNLTEFANQDRKMLVNKSFDGKDIKFFERPGLWNGSMHNWITIFVEMDAKFFNPVKSIVDVLNDGHQPK